MRVDRPANMVMSALSHISDVQKGGISACALATEALEL